MKELINKIEKDGYCQIPQLYEQDQIKKAFDLLLNWHLKTKSELSENIPFLNQNHPLVYNLQNKDIYFLELIFNKPIINEILMHFLNDQWFKQIPSQYPNYILRSYLGRSSNDKLPMHIDSFIPYKGAHPLAMQVGIILEDQNQQNGCTVLIPGSHKSGEYANQEVFEKAIPIESKSGDVVIWDSRIWHGTKENKTDGTRWSLIATFVRWWVKQAFNITDNIPQSVYEKLTDNQKAIMGFCSRPYENEYQGIDMKRGYEDLPAALPQKTKQVR